MDPFSSALELAKAIKEKQISPVEVIDVYLERTERLNPTLNAVIWRRDDELRRDAHKVAEAIAAGRELGPFAGVPIPIKDLTDVAGWPTTFGSRGAANRIASETANVVKAFADSGFLLMHRTNTPEFGTLPVTENLLFGATRNPWDTDRTPGGSSGGSAAAVAAGLAPVGHANDGGGSIRIPASCCGLVGLKPSRGRVSAGPRLCDMMHGGAIDGVVTRTVADTAAILDVISHIDSGAWYNAPQPERPFLEMMKRRPERLRVAFTTVSPTGATVAPECVEAVEKTARLLSELGHEVFEDTPKWPSAESILHSFMTVWNTGSAYWPVDDWNLIEPLNAALRSAARETDSIAYVEGVMALQDQSRRIVAAWGKDFDVLLTPTIASLPPQIGELFVGAEQDPLIPILRATDMAAFTPVFNVTGQPAISLPMHWSAAGLPVGVQLVGSPWDEATVLGLAAQLEEANPWAQRRPAGC